MRLQTLIYDRLHSNPAMQTRLLRLYGRMHLAITRKRIQGSNNVIEAPDALLRGCSFSIRGNNNRIEVGPHANLSDVHFHIYGDNNHIIIGERCRIYHHAELWIEDNNGRLVIGSNCFIKGTHVAVTENDGSINIGDNVWLGPHVFIRNGDSHSIIDTVTGKRINYAEPVTIEDHVIIFGYAHVLKGVTIGHDTIVAPGAVVTRSLPANCAAAGNPAKSVRDNVTWAIERIEDRVEQLAGTDFPSTPAPNIFSP